NDEQGEHSLYPFASPFGGISEHRKHTDSWGGSRGLVPPLSPSGRKNGQYVSPPSPKRGVYSLRRTHQQDSGTSSSYHFSFFLLNRFCSNSCHHSVFVIA